MDASALLAFLQGESGSARVEQALERGAVCGAANWSEVMQDVLAAGGDWSPSAALLGAYELAIEPVTVTDAEWAAQRWRQREGLSLADRPCLALGARLDLEILTADKSWGEGGRVRQIRA